jgi:hypothetical protein
MMFLLIGTMSWSLNDAGSVSIFILFCWVAEVKSILLFHNSVTSKFVEVGMGDEEDANFCTVRDVDSIIVVDKVIQRVVRNIWASGIHKHVSPKNIQENLAAL